MHILAFGLGVCLWLGATALLLEDSFQSGNFSTQQFLSPLLTLATAIAGIMCHRHLLSLRLLSGAAFLVVALFGSLLVVFSTTGRTAATQDRRQAETISVHNTVKDKREELVEAKRNQKTECVKIGPRCNQWNARVDALTLELANLRPASVDPRGDSLAKLATLLGQDGEKVRAIVSTVDPWALPIWLELASIVFLSAAFPKRHNSKQLQTVEADNSTTVTTVEDTFEPHKEQWFTVDESLPARLPSLKPRWTVEDALADILKIRATNSQQFLSDRWGWDKATVSRQLQEWEGLGYISRHRNGKSKQVLALPAPR